jgi:hypothetical protein
MNRGVREPAVDAGTAAALASAAPLPEELRGLALLARSAWRLVRR